MGSARPRRSASVGVDLGLALVAADQPDEAVALGGAGGGVRAGGAVELVAGARRCSGRVERTGAAEASALARGVPGVPARRLTADSRPGQRTLNTFRVTARSLNAVFEGGIGTNTPMAATRSEPGAAVSVLPRAARAPMEVGMSDTGPVEQGEQIEAAEREAAKRRLLAQAEAERIPVEETTRAVPDRRWRRGQQ